MAITDIHQMTLSSGAVCLDFVNTGLEVDNISVERLHDYNDLLILTDRLKLMTESELYSLRTVAKGDPESAARRLEQARKLRKVLYSIFNAIADQDILNIDKKILGQFNTWRTKALAGQKYSISNGCLMLGWIKSGEVLLQPLWELVLSADELLQKKDLQYLRRCSGCDWLFYDQSKSHRRKWCDMQTCGSSAKAKRYYQRKKTSLDAR